MKKHTIAIILFVYALCLSVAAIVQMQQDKKTVLNQSIDLTIKLSEMNLGDSLIVSELTHYAVISEIEEQLKNLSKEVWLGNAAYHYKGIGLSNNPKYSKKEKFVHLLDRTSNSYYEVLIVTRKLDNGIYTAKCLVVFVSSRD